MTMEKTVVIKGCLFLWVLKIIAGELSKRLRKTDFLARFGGEEFVLLLPGTPLEGGQQLLETLRAGVESCPFHFRGEPVTITGFVKFARQDRKARKGRNPATGEEIDIPAKIYEAPRSSFVAAFIGDTNFFDGNVASIIGDDYCKVESTDFPPILCYNDKHIRPGSPVHLSIRPEKMRVSHSEPDNSSGKINMYRTKVEDAVYQGFQTRYWVRIGEYRISITQAHSRFLLDFEPIKWGDEVWLSWHADDGYMMEQYTETDEALLMLPPESIGDMDDPVPEENSEEPAEESAQ